MICIFDLDSIIANLLDPWLGWYNKNFDDNITTADIKTYHIEHHVKPEARRKIYGFFEDVSRYEAIPILAGASEGLLALKDMGHDVVVATATAGSTAQQKYSIVKRAAPWLPHENIILAKRKELIKGDVFVDDAPENLTAYRMAWPDAHVLTIDYPYNAHVSDKVLSFRALDWSDTSQAWEQLVDYIAEQD